MSGSRFALQCICKRRFLDKHGAIVSVHFRNTRTEQKIDPGVPTKFFVHFFQTWIAVVIASGFKLQRINEYAQRHLAIVARMLDCHPDHFPMRLVQSAHRGNKYTAFSMRLRLRLCDRRNDPHPRTRVDHGSKYPEISFSLRIKLRPGNLRMLSASEDKWGHAASSQMACLTKWNLL